MVIGKEGHESDDQDDDDDDDDDGADEEEDGYYEEPLLDALSDEDHNEGDEGM